MCDCCFRSFDLVLLITVLKGSVQVLLTSAQLSISGPIVKPRGYVPESNVFPNPTPPPPSSLPMADSHISTSNQTRDPSAIFTAIFEAASNEYKTLTGQDLRTHPLATELERNNDSPDSIMGVFRKQAQALDKFRKGDDKLMKSLTPIVHILFTFSTTAGADIGLVGLCFFSFSSSLIHIFQPFSPTTVLFAGIGVLLGVSYFSDSLVCILETFLLGGERCYRELRSAYQPLRAHSIIPSTYQPLHHSSARTRDDGVAGEDSGPSPLCSCAFNERNEGEANKCVDLFQIFGFFWLTMAQKSL